MTCELCTSRHPRELWRCPLFYVIDASDADLPGFIRVILADHRAEMTDLAPAERQAIYAALEITEEVMRETLQPLKINLAQFGNMVPHLHWHVIARWSDDAFFPGSVWSARCRTTAPEVLEARRQQAETMKRRLVERLSGHAF